MPRKYTPSFLKQLKLIKMLQTVLLPLLRQHITHGSLVVSSQTMYSRTGDMNGKTAVCRLIPGFKAGPRLIAVIISKLIVVLGPAKAHGVVQRPMSHSYPQQVSQPQETFHFPASPHLPAHPYSTTREPEYTPEIPLRNSLTNGGHVYHQNNGHQMTAPNTSDDEHYWKHMFIELGFGGDSNGVPNETRNLPQYTQNQHTHSQHHHQQQGQITYHHMPTSQPTYGR